MLSAKLLNSYLINANHAIYVYNSRSGYTARAFRAGETEPAMNGTDAHEHHANATSTMIHLAMMFVTQIVIMAATSSGKMQ